jgi:hypothetical protein
MSRVDGDREGGGDEHLRGARSGIRICSKVYEFFSISFEMFLLSSLLCLQTERSDLVGHGYTGMTRLPM